MQLAQLGVEWRVVETVKLSEAASRAVAHCSNAAVLRAVLRASLEGQPFTARQDRLRVGLRRSDPSAGAGGCQDSPPTLVAISLKLTVMQANTTMFPVSTSWTEWGDSARTVPLVASAAYTYTSRGFAGAVGMVVAQANEKTKTDGQVSSGEIKKYVAVYIAMQRSPGMAVCRKDGRCRDRRAPDATADQKNAQRRQGKNRSERQHGP
jgi:hypothetical protein